MPVRKPTVLKRQRQEEKKKLRRKSGKSKIKTIIKKTKQSVLSQDENAGENIKKALKAIDKACSKKIIPKNTASRKKSRLAKFSNKYSVKAEKI